MTDEPRRLWLVTWWMNRDPMGALFASEEGARAAANVRNGLLVQMSGLRLKVDGAWDYYRRDEKGEPMPLTWRDVGGPGGPPCIRLRAQGGV